MHPHAPSSLRVSEAELRAGAPPDSGLAYGSQLHRRAVAEPDGVGLVTVGADGSERALTWDQLDRRANQWGRALGEGGAVSGSLVAMAIPNSQDLVLSILGCWKIGAVPVPMRWDIPDWERRRLLDVIQAAVVIEDRNRVALATRAAGLPDEPLPQVVSPAVNGICSSGSTGFPKVILNIQPALWTPEHSEPFIAHWATVSRPQTILVPGPMYHTNGFSPLLYLLGGDRLIVLEKFSAQAVLGAIERHRVTNFTATPTML
ncbi:MAG: bile acid-coenzyme ligase, partial [Mycobacterium sp.]|nr:bile acid-coenzyme ligase [Mycobacterium sp.]